LPNSAAPKALSLCVGSELDLQFTDLMANGQAVGRADGLVVFCFGPLPGERARVRLTQVKRSYAVAEPVELRERSPERVDPFCPVFGECGGCQVQHLSYRAQLEWKRTMLSNALQRIGGIAGAEVDATVGVASPRAYRNKMTLVVERRDRVRVGFYRMRSHDVVPIESCPVVVPQLDAYISAFANALEPSPAYAALADARHIVARQARASGEAVLSFTTPHRSQKVAGAAGALIGSLPGLAGVVNSYEPRSANAVTGRKNEVVAGRAEIEEELAGMRYRVSSASFFQINAEIVERIFEAIRKESVAHSVVDLYCGMGTFSLLFAGDGARVLGVEENAHAVAEAAANAELNAVSGRCSFEAGRVEDFASSNHGRKALASADLVFLDPPRKGSDEATLRAISRARPPRIGYLSCDPATLARDLKALVSNGYRLGRVRPFDMFPQTGHVETLVFLQSEDREGS
jgi:23S rRNA (uracil1939-C5)-methyltransferase